MPPFLYSFSPQSYPVSPQSYSLNPSPTHSDPSPIHSAPSPTHSARPANSRALSVRLTHFNKFSRSHADIRISHAKQNKNTLKICPIISNRSTSILISTLAHRCPIKLLLSMEKGFISAGFANSEFHERRESSD